jgi:hypothetical protein
MRSLLAVGLPFVFVTLLAVPASAKDTPRTYVAGRLLDMTVQPVDRGTAHHWQHGGSDSGDIVSVPNPSR